MQPSIYKYLDYRQFLRDILAHKKSASPAFSLEMLGRKTGCITKSHLSLILSGKRTLTTRRAAALGKALGLSDREIVFYHKLIQFNQAKDDFEKEQYLGEMMSQLGRTLGANLSIKHYQVLEEWHGMAIRELARLPSFDPNPQAISARLKGLLTPQAAKKSLSNLVEAGLLKINENGDYKPSDETLRTTDEVNNLAVRKYHKSCLELGKKIIETEPIADREFGSINFLMKPEDQSKLKELLKSFREQILALSTSENDNRAKLTQVNIQMFHLSN